MNNRREKLAKRIKRRGYSENQSKRTPCTRAVIEHFGIKNFRYSQQVQDVVNVIRRNGYTVRSRNSKSGIKTSKVSVGKLRKKIASGILGCGLFIVNVNGHVLLLDSVGNTIVDTLPRLRDKRLVYNVHIVHRI